MPQFFRIAAAAAIVVLSTVSCVSTPPAPEYSGAPQTPVSVERGKYLVQAVMACGLCHVQRGPQGQPLLDKGLSGGTPLKGAAFRTVGSNITPDMETGIGKWTDAQVARAIREGVRPDGSLIGLAMPVEQYRHLSDNDVKSVVAFLRSQPAVANAVAKPEYDKGLPANYGPPLGTVFAPVANDKLAYGKYLVGAAFCLQCHTPRNNEGGLNMSALGAGGWIIPGPWGQSISRNLTPHESGLREWTDAQIATAVRTGVDRSGGKYKPPMPFTVYNNLSEEDMAAMILYLRKLEPKVMGGGS